MMTQTLQPRGDTMTDAEKITEINALIDEIGEVIESNKHPDGSPGTVILGRAALLNMIDMAHRQIEALSRDSKEVFFKEGMTP